MTRQDDPSLRTATKSDSGAHAQAVLKKLRAARL
jgi:hypothetical protein